MAIAQARPLKELSAFGHLSKALVQQISLLSLLFLLLPLLLFLYAQF